jgi:membrane protease YdiL (CAAX protease family)
MTAALLAVFIVVSLWTLTRIARYRGEGHEILPYQPRRPAPWSGFDVAVVLLLSVVAGTAAQGVVHVLFASPVVAPADTGAEQTTHFVEQLMMEGGLAGILLACLSAIVVAPLVEEFLFRLVLQGWLEKAGRRYGRRFTVLARLGARGAGPVVVSSLLFAALHFRTAATALPIDYLLATIAGSSIASLVVLVVAVWFLRARAGATAADLGWAPERLGRDAGLGLAAFAAVVGPVFVIQATLIVGQTHGLLPKDVSLDPVPLFLFALVLGTLYWRTHRLVPSIVLHMALNATSVAMLLFRPGG